MHFGRLQSVSTMPDAGSLAMRSTVSYASCPSLVKVQQRVALRVRLGRVRSCLDRQDRHEHVARRSWLASRRDRLYVEHIVIQRHVERDLAITPPCQRARLAIVDEPETLELELDVVHDVARQLGRQINVRQRQILLLSSREHSQHDAADSRQFDGLAICQVALLNVVPRVAQQGGVVDKVAAGTAVEDPVVIFVVTNRHCQTLSVGGLTVATSSFADS